MINLIRQLPAGSRLDRAMRGEAADWDLNAQLLMATANALIAANYQRASKRAPSSAFIKAPNPNGYKPVRKDEAVGGAKELDELFKQMGE